MALDISLDLHNTGQPCRYWRITSAHLDHTARQATLWLHGWADAPARSAGRTASAAFHVVLHADTLAGDGLHNATTAALYDALKASAARAAADTSAVVEHAVASFGPELLAGAQDC